MLTMLLGLLAGLDLATAFGLAIIAATSGFMTYGGMAETLTEAADPFWWKCAAAIVSVGISVSIALFWAYALAIVPNVVRSGHRGLGTGNTVAFLFALFFLSQTWNATFFSAPATPGLNLVASNASADQRQTELRQRLSQTIGLVPDIELFADELDGLADAEQEYGALTGEPGCKGVCTTIRNVAASVSGLASQLKADHASAVAKANEAKPVLTALRGLATAAGPIEDRLAEAGNLIARVNSVMADAQGLVGPASVARTLSVLPDSFVEGAVRSQGQRDAVAKVRALVAARTEPIARRAAELAALPPVAPAIWHNYNALLSAFVHWRSLIAQWAAGIMLDWTPAFLLVFKAIGIDAARKGEPNRRRSSSQQYTVNQLLDIRDLLKLLDGDGEERRPKLNGSGRSLDEDDDDPIGPTDGRA